ncbi:MULTISPECIES: NAD(P)-dependent malic enzyme [Psychrilyobacter]|uniref:NADP-dependent malic enzyme n=3 Tax=Psychrilyobacter TaxID=623282 RepID=A0ABX9KJF4_9FUSO|nr:MULTISPECIES: NADP-dependent malic enzyme [Psychrilyobacter]NDI77024.1 NADP-dependent malic enzyme [Psychrilyobacter piezotolerans]RDE64641.1 NADP-dependent malic enzyme [Psychrilyobacter sp. S5]REI42453.1 NADP-dependent malic enzyme [Psychrilyobacter piezotolerans]
MSVYEESLKLHIENKGKIEVISKVSVKTKEDLSLAYSPGVAEPCKKIAANKNDVYKYTAKGNMVAVITDGTAVLGLGDIGPEAALPVMEGKAILFKEFGGVDAFPICLDTKDTEEIIRTCKLLAPSFGGINLEDIAAPKCVEIERRLIEELDIPVFHDDQHGTAIVTTAAVINSCKLLGKNISDLRVSMIGTGSAGSSIARMLKGLGVKSLYAYNSKGVVMQDKYDKYRFLVKELLDQNIIDTPENLEEDSVAGMMKGTDVFVGVSGPDMVTKDMVRSMNTDPIILAMANPTPEIMPEDALEAGAAVVGTGRSDYPNQVNNVLAFPGLFKGALEAGATVINDEMKIAAAYGIANVLKEEELRADYIIPSPFDERVASVVAETVKKIAIENNLIRKQ